jgi:threonyl-tRNA synthetase
VHIGGEFTITPNPSFIADRAAKFEALWAAQEANRTSSPQVTISVTLPNGDVKQGIANVTSPYDIAKSISQGLADNVVVAKVEYANKQLLLADQCVACDEDEEAVAVQSNDAPLATTSTSPNGAATNTPAAGVLWDLSRPLLGDCHLTLLKFDDPEAKTVFWHSSAHILGAAIEALFGAHLTIGPPLLVRIEYRVNTIGL